MPCEEGPLSTLQLSLRHRGAMEAAQHIYGSCQGIPYLGGCGGHMYHEVASPQAVKLAEFEGDVICQPQRVPHLQVKGAQLGNAWT